jgi:hypothetical protein
MSRASRTVIWLIECSTPKRKVCGPPDLPSKFCGVQISPLPWSIEIGSSSSIDDGV